MTLEEKVIVNSQIRQRTLGKAAKVASEKPDTGVTILKKSAFYVIKDCADITQKYLAHLAYGSYTAPIAQLKGKFTQSEIIDFVGRSKIEYSTKQLLHIILTDIGSKQYIDATKPTVVSQPVASQPVDLTVSADEDVYGDYNTDNISTQSTSTATTSTAVSIDDVASVIETLINIFEAK